MPDNCKENTRRTQDLRATLSSELVFPLNVVLLAGNFPAGHGNPNVVPELYAGLPSSQCTVAEASEDVFASSTPWARLKKLQSAMKEIWFNMIVLGDGLVRDRHTME